MSIDFIPSVGQVLMCDYESDGFIRPEMQKIRHCVVVSPRYRRHTGCCLVVPFSTVEPEKVEPYHYKIPRGSYGCFDDTKDSWAKCDMLTHAAFARLERPRLQGRFSTVMLTRSHLSAIKRSVLCALGVIELQWVSDGATVKFALDMRPL